MTLLATVIARGTLAARPAAASAGRLYFDTTNSIMYRDNGASWDSVEGAAGMTNPMTTAGDLIVGGASGAPTRLAGSGTDGWVATYDSTATPKVKWAAAAGGSALVDLAAAHGTASANTTNSTFVAANVLDDDDSTWHIHTSNSSGETLTIDLAAAYDVVAWRLSSTAGTNRVCTAFLLESSPDNSTWTTRAAIDGLTATTPVTADTGLRFFNSAPINARYWRFRTTAGTTDPWAQGKVMLIGS